MSEDEDRDALAAEYVLGTLDLEERTRAEALITDDAGFAALVHGWERRLGALQAMVEPIEPPPQTWDRIRSAVAPVTERDEIRLPGADEAPPPPRPNAELSALAARMRRWRGVAAVASALAAALLVLVAVRELAPGTLPGAVPPAGGRYVAVLQQSTSSPAFLLTVDIASRTFTIRRVGAADRPGRSYELWLVSERFNQPRSLGVVGEDQFTTRATLASYEPDTINQATYAISLEPQGGSPTGVPTGPVLFVGRLIEATPP